MKILDKGIRDTRLYQITHNAASLNKYGVYSIIGKGCSKNNIFEILFLLDSYLYELKRTKRCFFLDYKKNQRSFINFLLFNKYNLNLKLFRSFSIKYQLIADILLLNSKREKTHIKNSKNIVGGCFIGLESSKFLKLNKFNMYLYLKKLEITIEYTESLLVLLSFLIRREYNFIFVKSYLDDILMFLSNLNLKRLLGVHLLVEQLQLNFYSIVHKINYRVNYGFFPEIQFFLRDSMKGFTELSFNSFIRQFWLSRLNKGLIFRLQRHYPFGDSISPTVDFAHKAEGSIMTIERWLELFFGAIVEDQEDEETLESVEVDGVLDSIITGFSFDQVREVKVRVLLNIAALRFQRRFYLKKKRSVLNKLTTHKGRFIGEIGRNFREKINLADLFYGAPQGILLGNGILERIEPVDKIRLSGSITISKERADRQKNMELYRTLQKIRFYSYYWYKNPYFFSFLIKDLKDYVTLVGGEWVYPLYFSSENEKRFSKECYIMDVDLMMQINNMVEIQKFYEMSLTPTKIINRLYRTVKSISFNKASLLNTKFDSTTMFKMFVSLSNLYEHDIYKFFSNYIRSVHSRSHKQTIIDYYNSTDIGSFLYHTNLFKEILNFLWYKRHYELIVNLWFHEFSILFLKLNLVQESLFSALGHDNRFLDFSTRMTSFDTHFVYNREAEAYPPWKPRIKNKRIINPKPRYNWFKFKPMLGVWLPLISSPYSQNKLEEARRFLYDPKSILRINYLDHLTTKEKNNVGNYYMMLKDSYLKAGVPKKTFEDLIIKYPRMSYFEFMLEKFWIFYKGINFGSLFGFGVFQFAKGKFNMPIMMYVTFLKQYMYYKRARVLIDTQKYILWNQLLNFVKSKLKKVIEISNSIRLTYINFLSFFFFIPLVFCGNLCYFLFIKGLALFFMKINVYRKQWNQQFRKYYAKMVELFFSEKKKKTDESMCEEIVIKGKKK